MGEVLPDFSVKVPKRTQWDSTRAVASAVEAPLANRIAFISSHSFFVAARGSDARATR